jgi:hypothetical protein
VTAEFSEAESRGLIDVVLARVHAHLTTSGRKLDINRG